MNQHRCHGCGVDEEIVGSDVRPIKCGEICVECSWEDHLAGMAHTGDPFADPLDTVPECCRKSYAARKASYSVT